MIKQISEQVTSIDFQNFGSIVYLIQFSGQNILIDTSSKENEEELISALKQLNLNPEDINAIILTHPHYDHMDNINLFPKAKIYSNFKELIDRKHARKKIKGIISIEKLSIKYFTVYKTPGHTFGDIVILYKAKDKKILFSGDVVFYDGYIGRTDFPESMPEKMHDSLKFVNSLKFDILCPGH
jgi:glyoxylase-like metal-dependent hydrolase (beta-lactamase superfamily II)